jgi:3-hydroxyacyl-[acyl-carrier-protein] dehydratase
LKFELLDKVESITPERIVAYKHVSLAEEYLADHFPSFPVLPGVMMLEALVQAAGWVLLVGQEFRPAMAVLKEARNVRYGQFVAPGNWLKVEVELAKPLPTGGVFKATGWVGEQQALAARLELACVDLAAQRPELAAVDQQLRDNNRRRWSLLAPSPAAGIAVR